jgi:hypothetical protein
MSRPRSKIISSELARCPALYRARLACKIGRDIISGETEPPCGLSVNDYAFFNLFHALDDIALALGDIHFPAETIDKHDSCKPTPTKNSKRK